MNKLIIMMNLCIQCTRFGGGGEKFVMHGNLPLSIANLIKTPGNGVHLVHRFINFINKVINIHNIYQLSYKNDEPMNPYEHTGAYAFFMPWLKEGVKEGREMEVVLEGQTTSRYIGSSKGRFQKYQRLEERII